MLPAVSELADVSTEGYRRFHHEAAQVSATRSSQAIHLQEPGFGSVTCVSGFQLFPVQLILDPDDEGMHRTMGCICRVHTVCTPYRSSVHGSRYPYSVI